MRVCPEEPTYYRWFQPEEATLATRTATLTPPRTPRLIAALIGALALLGLALTLEQLARNGGVLWAAAPGDEVALPGGAMRVAEVIPEHLAPMNHGQFARLGMTMAAMVPDATPEGLRSFTVLVALSGRGAAGMQLSADEFTVSGPGFTATPLRADLGGGRVPAGSSLTGVLVFRVPESARQVHLRYAGGQPVALALGETQEHH